MGLRPQTKSDLGLKKSGRAQKGKGKVSRVDIVKNSKSKTAMRAPEGANTSSGKNKIMNKLRGAGLVPL